MLGGRTLSEVDVNDARRVAVVNQTMVRRFFSGQDPIGQHIRIMMLESMPQGMVENPVFEVIGVVSDARNQGIQEQPLPEMLIPYTMTGTLDRAILVRTGSSPMSLVPAVRREIWAVDPNVALTFTGTLEEFLQDYMYAQPRFGFILLGIFAALGMVLVAIGVYSVIAYTVSRQTQEIAVRMALRAGRSNVLGMVFRVGLWLIGIGVIAGLLITSAAARVLSSQLFGISSYDPSRWHRSLQWWAPPVWRPATSLPVARPRSIPSLPSVASKPWSFGPERRMKNGSGANLHW